MTVLKDVMLTPFLKAIMYRNKKKLESLLTNVSFKYGLKKWHLWFRFLNVEKNSRCLDNWLPVNFQLNTLADVIKNKANIQVF
jgi:hypothetical protein